MTFETIQVCSVLECPFTFLSTFLAEIAHTEKYSDPGVDGDGCLQSVHTCATSTRIKTGNSPMLLLGLLFALLSEHTHTLTHTL